MIHKPSPTKARFWGNNWIPWYYEGSNHILSFSFGFEDWLFVQYQPKETTLTWRQKVKVKLAEKEKMSFRCKYHFKNANQKLDLYLSTKKVAKMQIDRNQKVAPSTRNISLFCDKFAFGVAFSRCRRKNAFVVFLIQHRLKFEYWQP